MNDRVPTPFRLAGAINAIPANRLGKVIENVLERLLSLKHLERLYHDLPAGLSQDEFLAQAFTTLNIKIEVADEELVRIPKTGALVVVANHPFGALEGLILAALLRRVRPDVKIMANSLLSRVPEVQGLFIAVNPFGGKQAMRGNMAPLKEAIRWLQQDGLLVVFPAGEVSHLKLNQGQVLDPAWSDSIGRLIHTTQAPVQSVYFHGSNSTLFQLAGLVHPLLRTTLLPRELINKKDACIPLRISQTMPYAKLKRFEGGEALIDYLRLRTYMLRYAHKANPLPNLEQKRAAAAGAEIVAAADVAQMRAEIETLEAGQLLVDNGELSVYYAKAKQIPALMHEIGRLREISFRAAGEGTGKAIDVDFFDNFYLHLFIWNKQRGEVVGAYRVGQSDVIMEKYGIVGLYTHSLFNYSKRLVGELGPALELGRSFVRQEYQKSFAPLLLLWKGIAKYVALNPRYRKLFGPVSISSDYQSASQQIMVEFLKANHAMRPLMGYVKPRQPFKPKRLAIVGEHCARLTSTDDVSEVISALEQDSKGVPILLKHYLKLGGKILGFNVDRQFNDALDALIMVDLSETEPNTLAKYMGRDELAGFLAWHSRDQRTRVG